MNIKLIYTVVMAFCVTMGSYAQGDIKWDYPIMPGTEEWKVLKNNKEKVDACQIPLDIIKKLSTKDLAQICLNYPLLCDLMFSNTGYQDGFDKISQNFNGFHELFERPDAATELLKCYKTFDLNSFWKNKYEEYTNVFYDVCIDVVLSQFVIIDALDDEQMFQLLDESLHKLYDRKTNADSAYRQKFTATLILRLLLKNDSDAFSSSFQKDEISLLSDQYVLVDSTLIDVIQTKAINLLKSK